MKLLHAISVFGFFLFASTQSYGQQDLTCKCSTIGLDPVWADTNKIVCYQIPVDRATLNPKAGKFNLAAVVVPALDNTTEKPLLYLHGGPGIATVENVPRYIKSETWKLLRKNRSLIFFDYRGTGVSEPDLCPGISDSIAKFSMKTLSTEARQHFRDSLYRQCRNNLSSMGIDIASFNSGQFAEDAEAIRKALKIASWNVYGVSFGTTVALNLLRTHGKSIHSMILDSPFPPNAPWQDFLRPFDTCFSYLEKKIANDPLTRSNFPSIRTEFKNAVARLNKSAAKIKYGSVEYDFTGDDFAWSIWKAMLNPKSIPFVPLAIHEVSIGNDSILSKWTTVFSDPNSFGKFSEPQSRAVLCYESRPRKPTDSREYLLKTYPDFSSFAIDFEGEFCNAWQPQSAGNEACNPVSSNAPVLILAGEFDPVCPPVFGKITAQSLSNSTFIVVPAASHAAIHVDDCVRQMANAFMANPNVKPQTKCISDRAPIDFVVGNLAQALAAYKR